MTRAEQIALVERYFAAVDGEDEAALLATLTEDCAFTVETHGVRLQRHAQIAAMFRRLWAEHAAVRHHRFTHVPEPGGGRIASRFSVENTERDGALTRKSNCNFFEIAGERFSAVAVYMAGPNTLKGET
ncbi:nuclear transport factor 2 family protein [Rhodovulum sp. 12E13]|uniref:nuclear transport factor 2 family protein n=1 Tax=Rhodovulum sp. 12E13 TaxID=2203891 RepID=UPI00131436E1|nr:nuclear transport factor 2 family protein [Rhodovulum sp. 12E13]